MKFELAGDVDWWPVFVQTDPRPDWESLMRNIRSLPKRQYKSEQLIKFSSGHPFSWLVFASVHLQLYLQLYCTHFHSYWWWWWNTFSTKYYKQKKFWWLLNYWMLVALKFDAQPMMEWTPTTIALMRHFSNITLKKEGYFHHHNHQKYQNHNQNYHFHHYMVL